MYNGLRIFRMGSFGKKRLLMQRPKGAENANGPSLKTRWRGPAQRRGFASGSFFGSRMAVGPSQARMIQRQSSRQFNRRAGKSLVRDYLKIIRGERQDIEGLISARPNSLAMPEASSTENSEEMFP
jgi:hypothetical protein